MKQFKRIISVVLVALLAFGTAAIAFADSTAETEENNTAATATAFTSAATGSLSSYDDIDYFKTTITTAGTAKLTFTSASASGLYNVEVLDGSENKVVSFNVAAGAGSTVSPEFNVAKADYYVKVTSGTVTGTETYTITLAVSASTAYDEVEPNDTAGTATAIASEAITADINSCKTYSGVINAGDVDWYKAVIVNPEGFFRIKFYNTDKKDFKVTIIQNATDKTIGEMNVTSSDEELTSGDIGVANGTYYIKIQGADDSYTGGYSFKIISKLDAETETEYNGDFTNATVIAQGTMKYASISSLDDVDYFKVTAKQDTKITVATTTDARNDGSVTWTAKLFSSSDKSNPLKTITVSKSQSAVFDLRDYDAGIYYIVVSAGSSSNYSAGNYTVTSEAVSISSSDSLSWIDQIKSMDWNAFWNNNFAPLLSNIDIWSTVAALIKLSIGTITKFIASSNSQS